MDCSAKKRNRNEECLKSADENVFKGINQAYMDGAHKVYKVPRSALTFIFKTLWGREL
jgi:hypothetical protein